MKVEQATMEQEAYREYLEALGILGDAMVRVDEEHEEFVPDEWQIETDKLFEEGRDRHYSARALVLLLSQGDVRAKYDRLEGAIGTFWESVLDREVSPDDRAQALEDLRQRRDEFAAAARDRLVKLRGF